MSSLAYQHMDTERRRIRNLTHAAHIPHRDKALVFDLLARDQIRRARAALKRAVLAMEAGQA